jgi:hypothetical protein
MVWSFVLFGSFGSFRSCRAAMKRTVGSARLHREPIATDCKDRGVNCMALSRLPTARSAVHSAVPPFRRAWMQFSREFHSPQGHRRTIHLGRRKDVYPTGDTPPTPSGAT